MSKPGKTLQTIVLATIALVFLSEAFSNFSITRRLFSRLAPRTENLAARVSGTPISNSQLDRAISERLWLEGKSISSLTPEEQKAARTSALESLIDHELLRAKIKTGEKLPSVTPEEITARVQRLTARFESKAALETAMKSQGIRNEGELKTRLAAGLQQEKFIESQIAPQIKVTDEDAKQWFSENQKDLANPERLEARHIFIPTLDHPPEEAKQKLDEALAALTEKKKDFATLAKELSEDPATKDSGGALGWMTYDRLPVDFAAPLFSLELNKPTLIRSRLGWHLAEVTARKPAEPRTFEQAKPEILAALETIKRRQAAENFRKSLRQSEAEQIEIF